MSPIYDFLWMSGIELRVVFPSGCTNLDTHPSRNLAGVLLWAPVVVAPDILCWTPMTFNKANS
jgi:hypothetical protein